MHVNTRPEPKKPKKVEESDRRSPAENQWPVLYLLLCRHTTARLPNVMPTLSPALARVSTLENQWYSWRTVTSASRLVGRQSRGSLPSHAHPLHPHPRARQAPATATAATSGARRRGVPISDRAIARLGQPLKTDRERYLVL